MKTDLRSVKLANIQRQVDDGTYPLNKNAASDRVVDGVMRDACDRDRLQYGGPFALPPDDDDEAWVPPITQTWVPPVVTGQGDYARGYTPDVSGGWRLKRLAVYLVVVAAFGALIWIAMGA